MKIKKNIFKFIKVYDFLEKSECEELIRFLDLLHWDRHTYYDYINSETISYEDDLYVNKQPNFYNASMTSKLGIYLKKYMDDINYPWLQRWHGYTTIRFNKYPTGSNMKLHCDHIQSIFDGNLKGIPILSILGFLNDDFKGGEFILCNEVIQTKPGQLMIFPSNFMYPHEVNTITEGIRYSFVSWAW